MLPKNLPRGIWMLGFVSLFMDVSSEMIHAILPLFVVGTLGASAALLGLLEGHRRGHRPDLEAVLRRAQRPLGQPQGAGAAGLWPGGGGEAAVPAGDLGGVGLRRPLHRPGGQGHPRRPARCAGGRHRAAGTARCRLRPAPVAGHGGRLRRSADRHRADVAVPVRPAQRHVGGLHSRAHRRRLPRLRRGGAAAPGAGREEAGLRPCAPRPRSAAPSGR